MPCWGFAPLHAACNRLLPMATRLLPIAKAIQCLLHSQLRLHLLLRLPPRQRLRKREAKIATKHLDREPCENAALQLQKPGVQAAYHHRRPVCQCQHYTFMTTATDRHCRRRRRDGSSSKHLQTIAAARLFRCAVKSTTMSKERHQGGQSLRAAALQRAESLRNQNSNFTPGTSV